jgi:hypothetical protein
VRDGRDILDIRRVHRRRLDGDDGVAVIRDGIGDVGDLQDARITETIKRQGAHG